MSKVYFDKARNAYILESTKEELAANPALKEAVRRYGLFSPATKTWISKGKGENPKNAFLLIAKKWEKGMELYSYAQKLKKEAATYDAE